MKIELGQDGTILSFQSNIFHDGFWSCFDISYCATIPPLGMGVFTLTYNMLGICNLCLFDHCVLEDIIF